MSHWVAPTFDVEELEKRIQDLKAVHFWLEQNTKALAATIQALEVQRMTLSTLQGMNVSMQEMAEAFKATPATADKATTATAQAVTNGPNTAQADPMQWWGALTEQFQTIAAGAMQDMNQQATQMMAASQAADAAAKPSKPKTAAAKKTAKPARKTAPTTRKAAAPKR
jgi:hypothetical protein